MTLCSHILTMQEFARIIVEGIRDGFRIGYDSARGFPTSSSRNMRSAGEHEEVVSAYISRERALGRVLGPFPAPPYQNFCTRSFGVIPKRNQPGKWRLVMDLSSPEGSSVNDGIDALEWVVRQHGMEHIFHYIDEFVIL